MFTRDVSSRKAEGLLTRLRKEQKWQLKYPRNMLRANFNNGCKAVNLARAVRRKNKAPPPLTPDPYFRRKQGGRQPAINSFQKLKIIKNTLNIGPCKIGLADAFDGEIKSFQIVETTHKITRHTRPEDRTYELHVQYEHVQIAKKDGDTKAIDLGANNMIGMSVPDNDSHELIKMPKDAKRHKHDALAKRQSRQSKRHKNGRNYRQEQRRINKKNLKIARKKADFVRKSLCRIFKDAAVVVLEDLKTAQLISKGYGKRGLNRTLSYASLGYVKDEIIRHCAKNGIHMVLVDPAYTSQTCSACGHVDKKSRDGEKFQCTKCTLANHADINAPENMVYRAVSGAAGNVVCKQDGMGRIALKVKKFQKERTNPDRFQFGSRSHAGHYCGRADAHLPAMVPLLLEKHESCTKKRCNFCM